MSTQTPNPPEFDTFAGEYDAALNEGLSVSGEDKNYFARGRIQWVAGILEKLGERPREVMDFGCGTGSATPFFLEWAGVSCLIGIDVSARSLDVAISRHAGPRTKFLLMQDYAPVGAVDLVFCNGVFHHIPLAERPTVMRYIYDSLRPGGIFALWENNPWNPGTRYVMSRIPFDRDAVTLSIFGSRRMVRAAGFGVVRSDFLFIFPRMLKWLRPVEPLVTRLPLGTQYLVLGRKPV